VDKLPSAACQISSELLVRIVLAQPGTSSYLVSRLKVNELGKLIGQTLRGKATESWNRYGEDICLARDLGCQKSRRNGVAALQTGTGILNRFESWVAAIA
jgi:hypothetical protein